MKIMINDIYIVVTNLKNQPENRLANEKDLKYYKKVTNNRRFETKKRIRNNCS